MEQIAKIDDYITPPECTTTGTVKTIVESRREGNGLAHWRMPELVGGGNNYPCRDHCLV